MTSLLALAVGEPASASASSSVMVVPVIVILPGRAHLADDVHELALVLVDLDPDLRVPDIAGRQHRRNPLLQLGERQSRGRHVADERERDASRRRRRDTSSTGPARRTP